ncbi:hypothetical protein Z517_09308 [Fonsecaea pedrosoi CBS 271.37]|uniref:Unplaced genomic scaffold supercont1.6, whole genome shotgun sequence n=1 Tax=Fonsecaea pedrosoi CBS 271.37 TaxID=1442368 RepID=A0A0D2GWY1_9EURO|nr:uncharacterized protein Z517_09308 [Fonsecaea pedrosoi CBS 271.37]KIW76864.1 hypothetical protein Z517_09308 [Fonsecaea pedrosoi CBS 271.37]
MGRTYISREPKPSKSKHGNESDKDPYFHHRQEHVREGPPKYFRPQRSSTTSRTSSKSKFEASKPTRQATEGDAIHARIPAGFTIKHWDPTEKPIILLGSVFDANSLGKWIYDWTIWHHGRSNPITDVAGELWLLLIKLAGKMKSAEGRVGRIADAELRGIVEHLIDRGGGLWDRLRDLLKKCEFHMVKAAKRDGTKTMGRRAGTEFVDSMFGPDRHLELTEKIMKQIRLWSERFDDYCEETFRRPSRT